MSKQPSYLQGRGRGRGVWGAAATTPTTNGGQMRSRGRVAPSRALPPRNPPPASTAASQQRFQNAAAKHQASIKQYVKNDDYSSSDSDSDLEIDAIMESLTKKFKNAENGTSDALDNTERYLVESMQSRATQCLVCIETVRRDAAVWNCRHCYATMHADCITAWIQDGVKATSALSDSHFPNQQRKWACPKCRAEYSDRDITYRCYCLKVVRPKFDPWIVPHSCGDTCDRPLSKSGDLCNHRCLLLCHPGPCAPCPKTTVQACYCSRGKPQTRRCGQKFWSCGQPCNRDLDCGQHRCREICHEGECPPCKKSSEQSCECGNVRKLRECNGLLKWNCDKVCGESLSCGHHKCKKICHPRGACGVCPLSETRTCPCGKSSHKLACTEATPTCTQTCEKMLKCGKHECMERCHQGDCTTCYQMTKKKCRCGSKIREQTCSKAFLCDTRCQKIKDCGIHICRRKCCDGLCPPCDIVCGKSLSCRNHRCTSICHQGSCFPCLETGQLSCKCGAEVKTVGCGSKKKAKPPKCKKLCPNPPDCQHPSREPHACHFDACPLCRLTCDRPLTKCKHKCQAYCHDARPTKIESSRPLQGPWDRREQITKLVNEPCPPCKIPVYTHCLGMHEEFTIECHRSKVDSCHRLCGQPLLCGNHTCSLECHVVKPFQEGKQSESCEVCEKPCNRPRPQGCVHKCLEQCHPPKDGANGCRSCTQMIRMRCHCGISVLHISCDRWLLGDQASLQSCTGMCPKIRKCGHACRLVCHQGECCPSASECTEKTVLRCRCAKRSRLSFQCNRAPKHRIEYGDGDEEDGDGGQSGVYGDKLATSTPATTTAVPTMWLKCDQECKEFAKKALLEKKEKEEELKRQKELQDKEEYEGYRKKMNSKKKRTNQNKECDKDSKISAYSVLVFSASIAVLAIVCYILFYT